MVSAEVRKQYRLTIGIECHVQLKTATKLFSAVGNDAREAAPNTLVSHIDFGLPGALPVLNREAVHLSARAAFALNAVPQKISIFDRKHYFYPDLPKGYQITQLHHPIVLDGFMEVLVDGKLKNIKIERAHIEEDAGKSTHPAGKDYSLVDLNRAGTPLLEIVSGPDMHSAAEAKAYAHELYLAMRYADVSDANLYYGNMRFDVNVSVSKTDELGTRTETKNINSFRAVEKVVEYEMTRQIEELEKGNEIIQETRGWDDAKQRTFSQRTKEDAHDYRYFPDPDIPPIVLDDEYIAKVRDEMPVMPSEWRKRLQSLGLEIAQVETLLDAQVEHEADFLQLLEANLSDKDRAKVYANWLVNIEIPLHREESPITITGNSRATLFGAVYELVGANKLSSTNAKALINELLVTAELPKDILAYAESKGYVQESDEGAIAAIVASVLASNPKAAEDVSNGEMKVIGFLVGQVMKESQGKANPGLAQQLIKKQLGIQ
jgi:aspartyl-tRNA(Asn)/glutamyl-tRNA(Gln) amidotransferase subunit B